MSHVVSHTDGSEWRPIRDEEWEKLEYIEQVCLRGRMKFGTCKKGMNMIFLELKSNSRVSHICEPGLFCRHIAN